MYSCWASWLAGSLASIAVKLSNNYQHISAALSSPLTISVTSTRQGLTFHGFCNAAG
jgi:hypothetical protein